MSTELPVRATDESFSQPSPEMPKPSMDLREVMTERGTLFVHGLPDAYNGNSPLMAPAAYDFAAKVGLTLALRPSLSASTTMPGDTVNHIWAPKGVILSSGRITSASSRDQGTITKGLAGRDRGRHDSPPSELSDSISKAINPENRGSAGYNEFTIEKPGVACLYVAQDGDVGQAVTLPHDVVEAGERFGLPVYVLAKGQLHHLSNKEQSIIGDPVDIDELLSVNPEVSPELREQIVKDILASDILKAPGPERDQLYQSQQGVATYLRNYASRSALRLHAPAATLPDAQDRAQQVAQIYFSQNNGRAATDTFLLQGDTLSERVSETHYNGTTSRLVPSSASLNELPFIPLPRSEHTVGQGEDDPITTVGAQAARALQLQQQIATTGRCEDVTNGGYPNAQAYAEALESSIKEAGFYLHGIRQAAEAYGDTLVSSESAAIADQLLPRETYAELLAKHSDAQGRFRITPDDLKALGFENQDMSLLNS